jgi:hypothetical protein
MPAYATEDFTPGQTDLIANALLFASLALLLLAAFLSMLVKGWIHDFGRNLPPITVPDQRTKEREYRFHGMIHYKLPYIVNALPIFIQLALVLFCGGLLVFLMPINARITFTTLSILSLGVGTYFVTTSIAVRDSSAPFPSPLSRLLTFDFRHPFTKKIFASAKLGNKVRDLDVRILNRLGDETLVAVENCGTFFALAKQLAINRTLQPSSVPRWTEIFTVLRPVLLKPQSPETIRGFVRAIAIVYDHSHHDHKSILETALSWMTTGALPQLMHSKSHNGTGPENADLGSLVQELPGTIKSFDHELVVDDTLLSLFNPISTLPSMLKNIRELLFTSSDWDVACAGLRKEKVWEGIGWEPSWLAEFFESSLFIHLQEPHRASIVQGCVLALREFLIIACLLPISDAGLLTNSCLQVAVAIVNGTRNRARPGSNVRPDTYSLLTLRDPNSLSSEINLVAFGSFVSQAIKPGSTIQSLLAPVLLSASRLDSTSSLLHSQDLGGLDGTLIETAAQKLKLKELSHFGLLEYVMNSIPRLTSMETLLIFMNYWDSQMQNSSRPLDNETVIEFYECALRLIFTGRTGECFTDHDGLVIEHRASLLRNPWLVLILDNLFSKPHDISDPVDMAAKMNETPNWQSEFLHERIAKGTIMAVQKDRDIYVELELIEVLEGSSAFYTAFGAFCLCAVARGDRKNPIMTEVRAARFGSAVAKGLSSCHDLEVWYFIAEFLSEEWLHVLQHQKTIIVAALRRSNFLRWQAQVCRSLQQRLVDNRLLGSDGSLALNKEGEEENSARLRKAALRVLPFLVQLLEGFEPPLTADEVVLLQNVLNIWNIGDQQDRGKVERVIQGLHEGKPESDSKQV